MELQRVGLEQDQAKREREFFVCLSSMSQRTISPGFVQLYSEWRFTIANGAAGMESIASSENEEHSQCNRSTERVRSFALSPPTSKRGRPSTAYGIECGHNNIIMAWVGTSSCVGVGGCLCLAGYSIASVRNTKRTTSRE